MTMVTIPMDIADLDRSLGRHEGHWRARCVECGLQYQPPAIESVRIWGPKRVLDEFGQRAGEWRVDRHPRMLGDVTGNGRADIVGFGETGVHVAVTTLRPRNASVLVPLEEPGELLVKRRRPLVVGPRPFHRRSHHHHHGFRGRR